MNKIILLLGDLASGKSTYSHMLGNRYNCLVINKDTIKEHLGDVIGFKNREENKNLSKATFKIMTYVFKSVAKTHQDVILEANFHQDELDILYPLIKESGYEALTLVFEGDLDILFSRFMNRIKNEHRNPVHITSDLTTKSNFIAYMKEQRKLVYEGQIIRIDSSNFSYQDEDNFKMIDNFINK